MSEDDKDYDVGYGKPPKDSQYRKGLSGNLNGRPKGSKNLKTLFVEAANTTISYKENGITKHTTRMGAAFMQLTNKAAYGDLKAINMATSLAASFESDKSSAIDDFHISDEDKEVMRTFVKLKKGKQDD